MEDHPSISKLLEELASLKKEKNLLVQEMEKLSRKVGSSNKKNLKPDQMSEKNSSAIKVNRLVPQEDAHRGQNNDKMDHNSNKNENTTQENAEKVQNNDKIDQNSNKNENTTQENAEKVQNNDKIDQNSRKREITAQDSAKKDHYDSNRDHTDLNKDHSDSIKDYNNQSDISKPPDSRQKSDSSNSSTKDTSESKNIDLNNVIENQNETGSPSLNEKQYRDSKNEDNSSKNSDEEKKAQDILKENKNKDFSEKDVKKESKKAQISQERIDAIISELRANKERRERMSNTEFHNEYSTSSSKVYSENQTSYKYESSNSSHNQSSSSLKTSTLSTQSVYTSFSDVNSITEPKNDFQWAENHVKSSDFTENHTNPLDSSVNKYELKKKITNDSSSDSNLGHTSNNGISSQNDSASNEKASDLIKNEETSTISKNKKDAAECPITDRKVEAKDIGNVDLEKIKQNLKEADKYHLDFASVQGGMHILATIINNLDFLKERSDLISKVKKIRGVLIYKNEENQYTDYWGKLKFKKKDAVSNQSVNEKNLHRGAREYYPLDGSVWVDETGLFEGELCDKFEKIPEFGILTPNGFYQSKRLSREELNSQFTTIKIVIEEIADHKHTTIPELFKENKDISITDRLIFAHSYNDMLKDREKYKDCVVVCVCKDSLCKEPCEEIRYVDRKDLK